MHIKDLDLVKPNKNTAEQINWSSQGMLKAPPTNWQNSHQDSCICLSKHQQYYRNNTFCWILFTLFPLSCTFFFLLVLPAHMTWTICNFPPFHRTFKKKWEYWSRWLVLKVNSNGNSVNLLATRKLVRKFCFKNFHLLLCVIKSLFTKPLVITKLASKLGLSTIYHTLCSYRLWQTNIRDLHFHGNLPRKTQVLQEVMWVMQWVLNRPLSQFWTNYQEARKHASSAVWQLVTKLSSLGCMISNCFTARWSSSVHCWFIVSPGQNFIYLASCLLSSYLVRVIKLDNLKFSLECW